MNANTSLGTISLRVRDLQVVMKFYVEILGLEALSAQGEAAWLGIAGQPIIHLRGSHDAIPRSPRTTGLYHFALLLPGRKDLAMFFQHLVNSTAELHGFADHLVSEALYFEDPEGNGIEIYADRPRHLWQYDGDQPRMATLPLDIDDLLAEISNSGHRWTAPAGTMLGHVHLHVSNLDQAIQFYDAAIGFDMLGKFGDQAAFLSAGGYHHHVGINTWIGEGAARPVEGATGLRWFSIVLTNENELAAVRERLEEYGAEITVDQRGLTTADPSGNGIRLIVSKEGN